MNGQSMIGVIDGKENMQDCIYYEPALLHISLPSPKTTGALADARISFAQAACQNGYTWFLPTCSAAIHPTRSSYGE
jgi:hypothetical protein